MTQSNKITKQTPDEHASQRLFADTSRWVAILAGILFGILYDALPGPITLLPDWFPLATVLLLFLIVLLPHLFRHPLHPSIVRVFGQIFLGIATIGLVSGVIMLVTTLPGRNSTHAESLLRTAALLWCSNIIVFGLWYWEIDGGGAHQRQQKQHKAADFMFPQQVDGNSQGWVPHFFDYLFVAFTGATALSPADTFPLTRPAKLLMMIEALIAMTILSIIIGRGINIL
ncbi:MAG TPA: hypothetical protein VL461_04230 [Dictyobacter sp.]|nr:hypothetical protein [Dictyobacter sp.]